MQKKIFLSKDKIPSRRYPEQSPDHNLNNTFSASSSNFYNHSSEVNFTDYNNSSRSPRQNKNVTGGIINFYTKIVDNKRSSNNSNQNRKNQTNINNNKKRKIPINKKNCSFTKENKNLNIMKDVLNNQQFEIKELNILLENKNKEKNINEENNKNTELLLQIEKYKVNISKVIELLNFIFNSYNISDDPKIIAKVNDLGLEKIFDESKISINELFNNNDDELLLELKTAKNKISDLQKQIQFLTDQLNFNNYNENEYRDIIISNQKEINKLNILNEKLNNERKLLKSNLQNLAFENNTNDNSDQKYQMIENQNYELQKEIEILKSDKNSLLKILTQIKNTEKQRDKELNSKFNENNKLNDIIAQKENYIQSLIIQINQLRKKVNYTSWDNLLYMEKMSFALLVQNRNRTRGIKRTGRNLSFCRNNNRQLNSFELENRDVMNTSNYSNYSYYDSGKQKNQNSEYGGINLVMLLYNQAKHMENIVNT